MAKGNYPSSLLTRGLFQDFYLCCFQQNMTRRNPQWSKTHNPQSWLILTENHKIQQVGGCDFWTNQPHLETKGWIHLLEVGVFPPPSVGGAEKEMASRSIVDLWVICALASLLFFNNGFCFVVLFIFWGVCINYVKQRYLLFWCCKAVGYVWSLGNMSNETHHCWHQILSAMNGASQQSV